MPIFNTCREFLDTCLLFDIEVSESNRIYSIVAIIRRYRGDIAEKEYGDRCYGDVWEVPVVEMVW